ncbi:hypothetical protein AB0C34_27315 [Nocardia sp. NPDC049220]|uniref:hypothetical protein n=1 Tax=Nocardia sp. NPDC049220 TaxID=3155273 RepID=UPI0033E860F4
MSGLAATGLPTVAVLAAGTQTFVLALRALRRSSLVLTISFVGMAYRRRYTTVSMSQLPSR